MYNFITEGYDTFVNELKEGFDNQSSINLVGIDEVALASIEKLNFPEEIFINPISSSFGRVINRIADLIYEQLDDKYEGQLPQFCAMANKIFHASVISGNIFFINEVKNETVNTNAVIKKLSTFDGYVEHEGAANIVFNVESKLTFTQQIEKTFNGSTISDFMYVIGFYWLTLADEKFNNTKELDLNLLGEVFEIFKFAYGNEMWDGANEYREDEKFERKSLAAKKGHSPTYDLKDEAIKFWKENIDPNVKNNKAGEILSRVVPLSPKKLSEYVSEAKRKYIT